MYELIPLHENTYYMECPAKVGLYFSADQKAIIIDSGIDKDTAKKIERHLLEREVSLSMILNEYSGANLPLSPVIRSNRSGKSVPIVPGWFHRAI